MEYKKKLIEVALPLDAINAASVREKSIRHGHPSTLHLWWARRPLATARAVIWASLVDDPSSHPEQFPTVDEQATERKRLFGILEKLVVWENSNSVDVLDAAQAEIMKSTNNKPPEFLDPFAGGGAIPLEAQRLGLKAHAHDLNPVAVMINKSMIDFPARFSNVQPVNPQANQFGKASGYTGANGIGEDVRYYGEWIKEEAYKRIGHLYPKAIVPKEQGGGTATVIAWIWARKVKCQNPACGCEMPLIRSFALSKKKGKEAYIEPVVVNNKIVYQVRLGKKYPEGTVKRSGAKCIFCEQPVDFNYIRSEAKAGRMTEELIGIIGEGVRGRVFCPPTVEQEIAARLEEPETTPNTVLPEKALGFRVQAYGMLRHKDLFTNRQLTALTTLGTLVHEVQDIIEQDARKAGMSGETVSLAEGGTGTLAYSQAVSVYLSFLVDQIANHESTICSWNAPNTQMRSTFARQAIPMVWDFAECNLFSNSSGSFDNLHGRLCKAFTSLGMLPQGEAKQFDAQSDCGLRNIMISTDPPYYDNIGYADLSDYFYVWMRMGLKETFPKLFRTMLVPKAEELIATPFRFDGNVDAACSFFENGMYEAFRQVNIYATEDIPVTIYYAFKQNDSADDEYTNDEQKEQSSASSGWETMLSAVIRAGFAITGTWPMRTEKPGRSVGIGNNALASSIVLVCRKRSEKAQSITRRNFINELKRELKPALQKLQQSNIAPVDLAQSAIGPGMGVFSKYKMVLEANGSPMSVRSALQIINQELDHYFTELDGELDRDSRFCVDLYAQYAFNDVKFGEADVLARAKNTSVEKLRINDLLYAEKGIVRLLTRDEITERTATKVKNIWLLTQQLTRALEKDGVAGTAKIVADIYTSEPEHAKALAYRLFQIAERKGWAGEAYAYNSLVIAWPDVQSKVTELQSQLNNAEQMSLFDVEINK